MNIHPRVRITSKAKSDLQSALARIIEKHELTPAETISLLLDEAAWWQRWLLREERKEKDPSNSDNTTEHLEEKNS